MCHKVMYDHFFRGIKLVSDLIISGNSNPTSNEAQMGFADNMETAVTSVFLSVLEWSTCQFLNYTLARCRDRLHITMSAHTEGALHMSASHMHLISNLIINTLKDSVLLWA